MSVEGISLTPNYFPYQKRSQSAKTKQFFKDCVQAGITISGWEGGMNRRSGVRASRDNKLINYNLYNDIVDSKEIERVTNPFNIRDAKSPAEYRNYPLLNPNISVLVGEERKRTFNPIPIVVNEDATTERIETVDAKFTEFLVKNLTSDTFDEAEAEAELEKLQEWATYTYKDKRERMAWQTLDYLMRTLDVKEIFSRGFEDLLISAEQIYVTDIYGGEPVIRKGNPLCFHTLRSGESHKIEDSDIIIEDGYLSIGETIDRYYEDLTAADIKNIEQGYSTQHGAKMQFLNPQLSNSKLDISSFVESVGIGSVIEATKDDTRAFGGSYDQEGNVRVTRVVWRGMRKIRILKYYDDDGMLVKDIMHENYEPDEELGEEVYDLWIGEWYEGTRIADDIYVRMQPRPVQVRRMDNLSMGHPGIVGTVFNVNNSKGKSMMDYGKNWQYLWNIFMYRTEAAFAKAKGKIGKLPLHLIPDNWDMDKWMYYAEVMGWAVEDAFNEGQRGMAKGKLAGGMNQSSPAIDLEMTEYIQNHLAMLDFIQRRADEITGITPQRKGSIDNRETVGGVERAVMQSSHITEKWFGVHDNTKSRALAALLETAKIAWKGKSFKKDYVLDDGTKAILEFDGDMYVESDYGIHISNSSSDMEMLQSLKSLSEYYIQNQGSLSVVADLYRTKNPADLQRKIEKHENAIRQAEQEAAEAEREAQQAEQERLMEEKEMEYELELEKLDRDDRNAELDRQKDILVAQIRAAGFAKGDSAIEQVDKIEGIASSAQKEIQESEKLELEKEKVRNSKEIEEKKLALEEKKLEYDKKLQEQKKASDDAKEKAKKRKEQKAKK